MTMTIHHLHRATIVETDDPDTRPATPEQIAEAQAAPELHAFRGWWLVGYFVALLGAVLASHYQPWSWFK